MDSLKKISSMHIERLKKEEDEEQWISGEELNTEGESDEEGSGEKGGKSKTKRRDRTLNHRSHLLIKSKLAASCGHHSPSKGASPPSPPPALMPPSVSITQDPGSACSEPEPPVNISWKPKRGSIKLPNIDLDALGKLGNATSNDTASTNAVATSSNTLETINDTLATNTNTLATSTDTLTTGADTLATTTTETLATESQFLDQGSTSSNLPD